MGKSFSIPMEKFWLPPPTGRAKPPGKPQNSPARNMAVCEWGQCDAAMQTQRVRQLALGSRVVAEGLRALCGPRGGLGLVTHCVGPAE
jgi:hypothetical protein